MALEFRDGTQHSGLFQIGDDTIPGELILAGPDTRLKLHQPEFFFVQAEPDLTLHGKLTDLTKVSLLTCLGDVVSGPNMRDNERHHTAEVEPRYVLLGGSHIRSDDLVVRAIKFVVSDATMIFNDSSAFSLALAPPREHIEAIIESDRGLTGLTPELGQHPMVAYYTGKGEVFAAETVLGRISATYNVSTGIGGADGVGFRNTVWTRIAFAELVSFNAAIEASFTLLRFLEIIAGRKQTVIEMKLETEHDGRQDRFQVYWPLKPVREARGPDRRLHPLALPLDAARQPDAFGAVLAAWLVRDRARVAARAQFSDGFSGENRYNSFRLIGAANMFDLLPEDAGPATLAMTADVLSARDQARGLFKALPETPERDMVLSALGRIGKPVLKRKIRHRAAIVTQALAKPFPHLDQVIDLAVELRNVLVHGSASDLDITGPMGGLMPFLTDVLEFLFVTSELIEAGWDAAAWERGRLSWDHPMGHLVLGYDAYLQTLDAALPPGRRFLSPEAPEA